MLNCALFKDFQLVCYTPVSFGKFYYETSSFLFTNKRKDIIEIYKNISQSFPKLLKLGLVNISCQWQLCYKVKISKELGNIN